MLDLGAVIARIIVQDEGAVRTLTAFMAQMRSVSTEAGTAAQGTAKLDGAFAGVAASADKATSAVGRSAQASAKSASADEKAAATAKARADAQTKVTATMAETATESTRVQQATLRQLAANERLAASAAQVGSSEARTAAETARLASAQASAIGASDRLAAAQTRVAETGGVMAASTGKVGSSVVGMARDFLPLLGALAAVKAAIDIGKQTSDFQRQMLLIRTQSGASAAELHNMSAAVLALAGPVATAPDELARSLYHFESIGEHGANAMYALRIAAEGAKVGIADVEDTTNALTYTLQSGITGVKNLGQAMGVFNTIVGSGDMTMQQLVEAIGSHGLLANAKASGVSIQEVGAALAVLGDNGVKGVAASTALIQVFNDFLKPAASSGAALDRMGLSAARLRDDLSQHGLNYALQDLHTHLVAAGDTGTKLKGALADIFTKRASQNMAIILGNMDLWNTKLKANTDGANSFGSAWRQTTKTVAFQFQSLTAQVDASGISLMQHAQPALAVIAHLLAGGFMTGLHVAGDALHPFVTGWHDAETVLGPAEHVLADILTHLGPVAPVLKDVAIAALTMWVAFKGYQIARTAVYAIMDATTMLATRAKNAAGEVGVSMGVAQRDTMDLNAVLQRDLLATARVDADAAATITEAEAQKSAAFYRARVDSETASEGEIAAARANMEARQQEADAAKVQAAEIGAAADTAAADVTLAGDAAKVGWSGLLGPLALVGIGVMMLTSLFHKNNDSAQANTQIMQGYADSLKQSGDALATVNLQQTNKNLSDAKAFGVLDQLHAANALQTTDYGGLILAINGTRQQYDALMLSLIRVSNANKVFDAQTGRLSGYTRTGEAANQLIGTIQRLRDAFTQQERQQQLAQRVQREAQTIADGGANATARQARALGLARNAYLDAQTAAQKNTQQTRQQTAAFQAENDAASLLQQALVGLAGIHLAVAQALTSVRSADLSVRDAFHKTGDAIKGATKDAVAHQQAIQSQVSAAQQYAEAIGKQTKSSVAAVAAFKARRDALEAELQAQGKLTPAVQAYIDRLYNLAHLKVPPTKLDADTTAGDTKIAALQAKIDAIRQGKIPGLDANGFLATQVIADIQDKIDAIKQPHPAVLTVDTSQAAARVKEIIGLLNNLHGAELQVGLGNVEHALRIPGNASGGGVPEGLSWVGEGGPGALPELLDKRGPNVQVISHPQAVAFARTAGLAIPGYAKGTNPSLLSLASRYRDWNPRVMAAIAEAESSGNAHALNNNPSTGDLSYGLWQINMIGSLGAPRRREFGISSDSALFNPQTNVRAAHDIWRDQGYDAWSTYNSGAYQQYLGDDGQVESGRGSAYHGRRSRYKREHGIASRLTDQRASYESSQHPNKVIHAGGQWYLGGQGYASQREAKLAQAQAQAQAEQQRAQQFAQQLRAFGHSTDTVRDANQAFHPLIRELRRAGLGDKELARLDQENTHLDKLIRRRNKLADEAQADHKKWVAAVQHMHADARSFTQAARSGFDITTAGQDANGKFSLGRLGAQQSQYLNLLRKWIPDFKKIVPLFDETPSGVAMLRELAGGDPMQTYAEVHALASSPKFDKQLLSTQRQIATLTSGFGGDLSRVLDLPTVKADRAQLREDKRAEERTKREITHAVKEMGRELGRDFNEAFHGASFEMEFKGGVWRAVQVEGHHHKRHRHNRKTS